MKLLNYIASLMFILMISTAATAQEFQKNTDVLNFGIGFGSSLYNGGYNMFLPPLSISYEKGILDGLIDGNASIGVGGYAGITGSKYNSRSYYTDYSIKYTHFIIGARGTFHYYMIDNLDAYAGVMLGANFVSVSTSGNLPIGYSHSNGGLIGSFFLGGRYYLTPEWAGFLELGYGVSYINLGAAYRF